MIDGIVLINKPAGFTSHDIVMKVRKKFNMRQVGHAGTLDPLATGVLILLLGKGTKLFNKFVGFDKGYRATFILGTVTDTADIQGKILRQNPYGEINEGLVLKVFEEFKQIAQQLPPMYSAVKMNGKKLYQLARKGLTVERQPRDIRIDELELEEFNSPEVKFYLKCSKGTYVRQLAEDIGERLGCGACISQIERTQVGPFHISETVRLEDLNESHIRNWQG